VFIFLRKVSKNGSSKKTENNITVWRGTHPMKNGEKI